MKRFVITIITAIAIVLPVHAQNKTTLLQRVNEIKNQSEIYFWDQYTHPDADTAKVNATKRLLLHFDSDTDDALPSVEKIMHHAKYISIDRGNLKQYFVYIKKSEAATLCGQKTTITDNPVVGVPINVPTVTDPVQRSFVPDAFVQRVMETKSFMNVYKLLKTLQAQGQILQFGKLKDVSEYNSLDLILFDMQSQQIITMLSPVTASGYRKNVVNGSEDSLDNYPTNMTAVIWYKK